MSLYRVDGIRLIGDEGFRHRGAFNAALNGLIVAKEPNRTANEGAVDMNDEEWHVECAFEYADAAVREYRRRCLNVASDTGGG